MIISLVLIVYGWRHTTPVLVYTLPLFVKPVSLILMIVTFLLFVPGKHLTRIKSFVRHPQLMSIVTWSIAHLRVNGDSRSIVLFGGMGVWAIMEILLINRRDGEWIKEPAPAWSKEIKSLAISVLIVVIVVAAYPFIAGVSVR